MPGLQKVVIYDSILFERGHMIRRWAEALERRFTFNAIAEAPVNKRANKSSWWSAYPPGSTKASIRGETEKIGPKHIQVLISVNVPYAVHVINPSGPIFPHSGNRLRLPFNAGFSPANAAGRDTFHRSVPGHPGNDFMWRAHQATARRHPSLRGYGGAVFKPW